MFAGIPIQEFDCFNTYGEISFCGLSISWKYGTESMPLSNFLKFLHLFVTLDWTVLELDVSNI